VGEVDRDREEGRIQVEVRDWREGGEMEGHGDEGD